MSITIVKREVESNEGEFEQSQESVFWVDVFCRWQTSSRRPVLIIFLFFFGVFIIFFEKNVLEVVQKCFSENLYKSVFLWFSDDSECEILEDFIPSPAPPIIQSVDPNPTLYLQETPENLEGTVMSWNRDEPLNADINFLISYDDAKKMTDEQMMKNLEQEIEIPDTKTISVDDQTWSIELKKRYGLPLPVVRVKHVQEAKKWKVSKQRSKNVLLGIVWVVRWQSKEQKRLVGNS